MMFPAWEFDMKILKPTRATLPLDATSRTTAPEANFARGSFGQFPTQKRLYVIDLGENSRGAINPIGLAIML
jgi:hypothetical protein